jgi:hypothetical protein
MCRLLFHVALKENAFILEPISKSDFHDIGPFVVILAKAGIQCFQAFLDARLLHAGMTDYT